MNTFKHPLIIENSLKPRPYQEKIAEICRNKNLLCVLPTGLGKTIIGVLATAYRLEEFPDSQIIVLTPSKPLTVQAYNVFKKYLKFESNFFQVLTGETRPDRRKEVYERKKFLFLTPQTLENDLNNKLVSLNNVSLMIFDESHKSVKKYAYVSVAKEYKEQSKFPRILALTASPGGTLDKIKGIIQNLGLEAVEIRSEQDKDVIPHIQKREVEMIEVNLPEEIKSLHSKIKNIYLNKVEGIKKLGFNKPSHLIGKKDLLLAQQQLRANLNKGDKSAFYGISLVAQLLKLDYMLELIEIQGLKPLVKFFEKLKQDQSKAAKVILNNKEINEAVKIANNLISNNIEHPKFNKLKEIILEEIKLNPKIKIIVFANYRDTVDDILNLLKNNNIKAIKLIGQKLGLTQKEQINIVKEFEEGSDNVLIGTQILEEGIDIKGGAHIAIFYEAVPSDIRKIQRAGRVGRLKTGKIIFLITKNTRDEAYFWSSYQKEKRMKKTLYKLKEEGLQNFLENG